MKVVVGLGNPGRQYERTRHNLGFLVVDRIASEKGVAVKKKQCQSLTGRLAADGEAVLLVKPQTFMNQTGAAMKDLLRKFSLETGDLIVVHDDLDLPFGRIRIRPRGGAAGHRGVLSILEALGEEDFFRVRIGIGRPPDGVDPTDFVLDRFSEDEASQLDQVVSRAVEAVACLLEEGSTRAMEKFNRQS